VKCFFGEGSHQSRSRRTLYREAVRLRSPGSQATRRSRGWLRTLGSMPRRKHLRRRRCTTSRVPPRRLCNAFSVIDSEWTVSQGGAAPQGGFACPGLWGVTPSAYGSAIAPPMQPGRCFTAVPYGASMIFSPFFPGTYAPGYLLSSLRDCRAAAQRHTTRRRLERVEDEVGGSR
jgi:hypothetical protein